MIRQREQSPRPALTTGLQHGDLRWRRALAWSRLASTKEGCKVGSAQETIRAAAEAYITGDADSFSEHLHENARVLGSEQRDYWSDREGAMHGLGTELERRQGAVGTVTGSLIDHVRECEGVNEMGDVALWSSTGDLEIDGYYHRKASWTVVLHRVDTGDDWKIVHSHFSIHR